MENEKRNMVVNFINVGYGDAIFIEDCSKTILIDAGGNREDMYCQPGTIRTIDYLKEKEISRIDIVIVTHFHEDHICGLLQVIQQIEIGEIWINILENNISTIFIERLKKIQNIKLNLFLKGMEAYLELIHLTSEKHIPVIEVHNQYSFENIEIYGNSEEQQRDYKKMLQELFEEEDLSVLEEKALYIDRTANDNSLIIKIKGNTENALFFGDRIIPKDTIHKYDFLNQNMQAGLIKLPHHGQKGCIDNKLLELVHPKNVVITSDSKNTFGGGASEIVKLITQYYQDHNMDGHIYIVGKEKENGKSKSELCFEL